MSAIRRTDFAFFCCVLSLVSLVYSPFLLSVSMFALVGLSLLEIAPDGRLRVHTQLSSTFRKFLQQPQYATIMLFFGLVLLSGWQTEDSDYWMERLRLKLPFLLLPFAFYQLHNIIQKHNIGHRYGQSHHSFYDGVLYVLLLLMTVSCIGIGVHYWLNFEEINLAIQQGRAIPTPRNHIRFSLLLAISIISGGYLYAKKYIYRFDWERTLIACCTTFLFIFIHILSVRSGLLALYMALFALLVRFILIKKRYWIGLAGIVALTALPVASYYIVPSFQKKINYAVWDLRTYYAGKGANNSDSGRLVSLQVGWELAQRNMLVGVGAGNLRREVKNIYRQQFPAVTEPKMPHNQWVSVLAGTGILGIIIFGIAFFVPFFYNAHYRQPLFLGYYIIVFTSLLMENTLENSMGIGLYCFFTLLFLNLQYENSLLRETK